ncbi:hypothetical protein ACLK1S_13735 [Escherichia coli]
MAGYVESDRSVLWTRAERGDVTATERELQYTSEVLGLIRQAAGQTIVRQNRS